MTKANMAQDVAGPPESPSKVPLPPSSINSSTSLPDLLTALSDRLAETEMSIELLLDSTMSLSEQIESFPLLDRAKFCVTLNYAIDSLIFCYLRAKGANFKEHPVMKELERVKIYIRKLNAVEQAPTDRNLVLDQPAAQRMILHSVPKDSITRNPSKANEDPLPFSKVGKGKKRGAETEKILPQKKKSKTKKSSRNGVKKARKDKSLSKKGDTKVKTEKATKDKSLSKKGDTKVKTEPTD